MAFLRLRSLCPVGFVAYGIGPLEPRNGIATKNPALRPTIRPCPVPGADRP